jgi:DNA polymerase II small subunit/DNA polymerase delta subunit B
MQETGLPFSCAQIAMLKWRLIAPTGPASLQYAPHDIDILTFESVPHFYACGGADHFSFEELHGVKLLAIPKFTDTRTAVLLDLDFGNPTLCTFGT